MQERGRGGAPKSPPIFETYDTHDAHDTHAGACHKSSKNYKSQVGERWRKYAGSSPAFGTIVSIVMQGKLASEPLR